MWKRFWAKWRIWEEALGGIDGLQGDHLISLERRVASLENRVAILKERGDPTDGLSDGLDLCS
ncbi:hypothetical protein GR158_23765 [Shinella sp. AETb1-6]|nr:hypothetical protein [Shinella sumterensis]MXN54122.1 hypothetical protein [Shinella sp. AETb1-6]TFE93802.1 hypothetical protein B5M44_24565 [Shinella sumterensis]